jgi:hypothetical protein
MGKEKKIIDLLKLGTNLLELRESMLDKIYTEKLSYSVFYEATSSLLSIYKLRLEMANEKNVYYPGLKEFVDNLQAYQQGLVKVHKFSSDDIYDFNIITDIKSTEILGLLP